MTCDLIDVIEATVLKDYKLALKFKDGKQGEIDISQFIEFTDIFEPLKDKKYFAKVSVNADIGTICWPNGADISPAFLYQNISMPK
jgi:Protein of unknown function (DUF2442)